MELDERIRQSEMSSRSLTRLVGFLVLAAAVAFFFGILWLVKLILIAAGICALAALVDYWNAWRLKRRKHGSE